MRVFPSTMFLSRLVFYSTHDTTVSLVIQDCHFSEGFKKTLDRLFSSPLNRSPGCWFSAVRLFCHTVSHSRFLTRLCSWTDEILDSLVSLILGSLKKAPCLSCSKRIALLKIPWRTQILLEPVVT
jgi:hypothetical protein